MGTLDTTAIARVLFELGQRIELAGESPFKAKAYYRAAESLATLTIPLADLIALDRLREIPGVGAAIAATILELYQTGTHRKLEGLRREIPATVLDMLRIPGLAAQKVAQIHSELQIATLEELERAAGRGDLAGVKGLGPALQKKILHGIDIIRRSGRYRLIHHAGALLDAAAGNLRESHPRLDRVAPAGDFRRGCELVGDLRLVARSAKRDGIIRTSAIGDGIELLVADPARYGVALALATGSAEHIHELQAHAAGRGFTLDERGLRLGRRSIPCRDEEDVYAALGLAFVAPELREGQGEVALAAADALPTIVVDADLRGLLHSHTEASDGSETLAAMAKATRERGYGYFGVADHSQSAGYAGGLKPAEIAAQHAEADRLNRSYRGRFRIFKGIESDILEDGSLDYPAEILDRFDFVVASVHSRFGLDAERQTARIIRAVADPHTTILGHMTGRLLLRREGYAVDIDAILRACAEHGVAVEINANPRRLDLDWRWHSRALELGCMLSINPDAHSIAELDLTRWGVCLARKGGVPKERVLNCKDLCEITTFFAQRRERHTVPATNRRPRLRPAAKEVRQFEAAEDLRA